MHRPRRTIRLAKWAGVGLCVLIAATWAVSMFWSVGLDAVPRFIAAFESGVLIAHYTDASAGGTTWFIEAPQPRRLSWLLEWLPSEVSSLYLPLWIPLALLALPTALLFWLDRRRPRPGFCACGYDLTGNVSGRCPECGEAVA